MMKIYKAASRTARNDLYAALNSLEPRIARAFLQAIKSIRSSVTLKRLSELMERRDINGVVDLIGADKISNLLRGQGLALDDKSLQDELIDAFRTGGKAAQRQLPKSVSLQASLNITDPQAVRFINEYIPSLIREVSGEAQRAVQSAVLRGFEEGRTGMQIAREIRDSIGLTQAQQEYVANFRRQLETGKLGGATPPFDRRLSATEQAQARSIMINGPKSQAQIDKLVSRYYDSLVNRRAQTISRTEVHRAFTEGQKETWRQAQDRNLINEQETRRVWIVTPDERLREDHRAIPRMNPNGVGLNEPFQTPFGEIFSPADPVPELINCRCTIALEFI